MRDFDEVYQTVMGMLRKELLLPDVENAFEIGGYCDQEYSRMRHAYERLLDRLGVVDEDPDLDIMVETLENITRYVSKVMFEYGRK